MMKRWEFRRVRQKESSYRDGTRVPHVDMDIYFNDVKVGYVNVHMHKVNVDPGEFDHSVGITVRLNRKHQADPAAGCDWIARLRSIHKKTDRSRHS